MATVYSLICWGGKDGKTATMTIASPCVVTITNHGLRAGKGVVFSTTGALPTGVTAGTTYYVGNLATNTCNLYDTEANAIAGGATGRVNTSGTQSGTHTARGAYWSSLSSGQKARYGSAGSERAYGGIAAWISGRSTSSPLDEEVGEIGEAFTEYASNAVNININCAIFRLETRVDGVRSSGYHNGVIGAGFILRSDYQFGGLLVLSVNESSVDGFSVHDANANYRTSVCILLNNALTKAKNMIAFNTTAKSDNLGIQLYGALTEARGCIATGFGQGLAVYDFSNQPKVYNCISTKNTTGIYAQASYARDVTVYNTICIGNTTNWPTISSGIRSATNNAGDSDGVGGYTAGTPWATGTGIKIGMETTDFVSYGTSTPATTDNYRAAAVTSPQVETGTDYFGILEYDIAGNFRPSYPGSAYNTAVTAGSFVAGLSYTIASVGTTDFTLIGASANTVGVTFKATGVGSGTGTATLNAKIDIGPYEYDLGYGTWPASQPVSITNIVDGSRVKIAKQSDGTELYNAELSGSTSVSYTEDMSADTDVYVYVRKGSSATYYQPLQLSATIDVESGLSLSLSGLQVEDIAAGSITGNVATDWTINWSTGAITHASGTTRYTVQNLYSHHQNESDSSANIDDSPKMKGVTPTIFELINNGSISDGDIEDLKGGSIERQNGDLFSNVYNVGSLTGTPTIYIYQGTNKLTTFWSAGDIDVLLKVKNAGSLISSGFVTGYVRKWGYTYDHYEVDLSAGGRNVMPLSTLADINITETEVTVGGWSDVTFTFGSTSKDFGDGDGPQTYYLVINCNNRPLSEVYQRAQYVCRDGASGTLNGVAAETYQKANAAYTANKLAPFGTYAGGTWTLAQGIWLDNVPSSDSTNYILTDHAGNTHQNVLTPGAASATVLAGSRVQLYNVDTATEIDNTINADTSYSFSITTQAAQGETLRLRVTKLGYTPVEVFGVYNTAAGVQFLVSQSLDPIYAAWDIDGSTVSEFTLDVTGNIEIDANDVDGATTKTRLGAWYNYALTTADGIRSAFGAITALAVNSIRINVDVVDLTIENVNAVTALRFTDTDVRLYRSNGTTIIAASSYSIHNDYSGVPDVVETGVSGLTGAESAQLMGLPSASANATAILTAAQTTPIHANIKVVNDVVVTGTGVEGDTWGPA